MSANSPYSRQALVHFVCMGNFTKSRATSFKVVDNKIQVESERTTSHSMLTNGQVTYMVNENSSIPSFEEGLTYCVINYGTYRKYGLECMAIGPPTMIFRSAPLEISEEVQRRVKSFINPPSPEMSGDEDDLFFRNYVTLRGHIENLSSCRMVPCNIGEVPVRDLILRCGERLIDVSLWRDEALAQLHVGAEIAVTHLKVTMNFNGDAQFHSSRFSTVEVPDHPCTRESFTIIGLDDWIDDFILLTETFEKYSMSTDLFPGTSFDLLERLPLNVEVEQANHKIHYIQYLDTVQE